MSRYPSHWRDQPLSESLVGWPAIRVIGAAIRVTGVMARYPTGTVRVIAHAQHHAPHPLDGVSVRASESLPSNYPSHYPSHYPSNYLNHYPSLHPSHYPSLYPSQVGVACARRRRPGGHVAGRLAARGPPTLWRPAAAVKADTAPNGSDNDSDND